VCVENKATRLVTLKANLLKRYL